VYELYEMQTPDHAVVSQTVNTVELLNKPWAKSLVNAVLRNAQRRRAQLEEAVQQQEQARYLHPHWLIELLRQDWPQDWQTILAQNNLPAPMTLRLDTHRCSREAYLEQLSQAGIPAHEAENAPTALTLEQPADVQDLPGFSEGLVSVQDAAAQLAAPLLDPQAGERILDACAAPGGKTLHILQQQPKLAALLALDSEPARLQRVRENLSRAGLEASIVAGDARQPDDWWDGQVFDRILLDAPCSASGVIRRHPDIKLLRRQQDLKVLAQTQAQLLDTLWPLLKSGGMLLYATCSVLKVENEQQIQSFVQRHGDARSLPPAAEWGHAQRHGRQILPGETGMDGFYYATIYKQD
jgi:16S rRNA (cytosine967-C5)-methyltransferase